MTALSNAPRLLLRRCDGASAVEFAIIAPLFIMFLFGIVVFGTYLSLVHSVQQIAAEAARASVGGLNDAERSSLARSRINQQVSAYMLVDPSRLMVEHSGTDSSGNTYSVRLRYDAADSFIFILPTFLPMPPSQIVRAAAIQRGGY